MRAVTWAELRGHRSRVAALLAAIVISVGFVVGTTVFLATATRAATKAVAAPIAGADVVLSYSGEGRASRQAATLAEVPGVGEVVPQYRIYGEIVGPDGAAQLRLAARPDNPALQWEGLAAGRWPSTPTEVAVSSSTAKRQGITVGSTLQADGFSETGGRAALTVVGITDQTASLFDDLEDTGTVTTSFFTGSADRDQAYEFLVLGDGSVDPATLADRIQQQLGEAATVETAAAYTAEQVDNAAHGVNVFGIVAWVFGGIALLVAAVIIANTLTVVVAQRRRQLGLLRAAGASAGQVRTGVLVESATLGVVGALGGVALGVLAGWIASIATGSTRWGLAVPVAQVGGATALGVLVTVLAGIAPARQAARVSPVEALRPPVTDDPRRRPSVVRIVVVAGLALVGAGLVTLALVGPSQQVPLAVAGAALLTLAVIGATPLFLPPLLRLLGGLGRLAGPTGVLAAANTRRHPGRAAATAVALMLAVGLVVMLQVGVASVKQSVTNRIDRSNPVDVVLSRYEGPMSPAVQAAVAAVPGVTAVAPVATSSKVSQAGHPDEIVPLAAPGDGADRVVAAGWSALNDHTLLISGDVDEWYGLAPGQRVTLVRGNAKVTLDVVGSKVAEGGAALVTPAVLQRLDPGATTDQLWVRVPDKDQAGDVLAGIRRAAAVQPGVNIGGALSESASYDTVLDTLLLIATALLGVAVVIAVIGVGNTLGLSVLERTRESGLLRALGLQRRQLRGMLVVEAVLLALAGSLVGVVAGIGFGWLGIVALNRQADLGGAALVVPVGPTLLAVVVAVVAGALASLPPARRAARATPVGALAAA